MSEKTDEFEIGAPKFVNVELSLCMYYHEREALASRMSQNASCDKFYHNRLKSKEVETERLQLKYHDHSK